MLLTEHIIQANAEKISWIGSDYFDLSGPSHLKIESPGVDHLDMEVPEGDTYRFELTVRAVKL